MLLRTCPWLIALAASFAFACSQETLPLVDPVLLPDGGPIPVEVDAAPPLEPRLWVPPAPFEGPCPAGSLVTPAGCGEVWHCPAGWQRGADGFACHPPAPPPCADDGVALPDGTCLDPWACPEGWLPDADGACLPVVAECPDSAPVPGGCLPAPDCERAPPADALWVDAAAAAGGDGSAARPFADLGAAFAAGALRVALAAGRHAWPDGPHPSGALVWGACPAQVELVAAVASGDLTFDGIHLVGTDGQLALTVEGGLVRVVGGRASGPSHVLHVAGGSLNLVDSAVGPGERGLLVDGGQAAVAGVVFADLAGNAVRIAAGAVARLDRVYARDTSGFVVGGRATGADLQWVQTDGQALGVMPGGVMEVERVAITWPDGPLGLGALVAGELTARDLTVLGAGSAGVQAQDPGARVRLERAWVGRVAPAGPGPMWGVGAVAGARIELEDVRLDRCTPAGLAAFAEVTAVGLRVTAPEPLAETTVAMVAATGGRFTGRRIAWSAASGLGLWAGSEGAVEVEVAAGQGGTGAAVAGAQAGTLRLTDAALEGGGTAVIDAGNSSATPGEGPTAFVGERLAVRAGPGSRGVLACRARVELADAVFDGGVDGLRLSDSSSVLTRVAVSGAAERGIATESQPATGVCRDRSESPDGAGRTAVDFGAIDGGVFGVVALDGAVFSGADLAIGGGSPPSSTGAIARADGAVELDRARVRSGVGLGADGGRVTARGVLVDGAVGPAPAVQTPGALAQRGGRLELEQVRVVAATGVAVGAQGAGLTAADLRVEQTRSLPDGTGGAGLSLTNGATAEVTRVHLVDNRGFGLTTLDGTLALVDGVIERTAPDGPADGQRGYGAGIYDGSEVTVDGLVLRGNHTGGLFVGGVAFDGRRILVEGTRPARAGGPADGVVINAPSAATLADFVVRDQPGAGVVVSGATVDLRGGRIEDNGVGLLTRNAARVSTVGVVFAGNGADELCESACLDGSVGEADP